MLLKSRKLLMIIFSILGLFVLMAIAIYENKIHKSPTSEIIEPSSSLKFNSVNALGRIEPLGGIIKVAPSPDLGGTKVAQLLVKKGDFVTKGQIISILDSLPEKQANLTLAQEAMKVSQANLAIIKAGAKKSDISAQQANLEKLKIDLEGKKSFNKIELKNLEIELEGEKKKQTANLAYLKAKLDNTALELKRYQQLAENGAISESNLDQYRLNFTQAKESFEEAKANYEETIDSLTQKIRQAVVNNQNIIATLQQQILEGEAKLRSLTEIPVTDIIKAQTEINQAIANVEKAKVDIDTAYVKAPIDGQVINITTEVGEQVISSNGIVELANTKQMVVIAEVYESDISKISIDQKVIITSQNKTFTEELKGKVSYIRQQIGKKQIIDPNLSVNVDVRVIEVEILLDIPSSQKVSGLTYAQVLTKILID